MYRTVIVVDPPWYNKRGIKTLQGMLYWENNQRELINPNPAADYFPTTAHYGVVSHSIRNPGWFHSREKLQTGRWGWLFFLKNKKFVPFFFFLDSRLSVEATQKKKNYTNHNLDNSVCNWTLFSFSFNQNFLFTFRFLSYLTAGSAAQLIMKMCWRPSRNTLHE